MDIQVASNFERLLFELCGQDGAAVRALMERLRATGGFDGRPGGPGRAQGLFVGRARRRGRTRAAIAAPCATTGELVDPHTAVGVCRAAEAAGRAPRMPMVTLATAHPAKFPEAVEAATGGRPGAAAAAGRDRWAGRERFDRAAEQSGRRARVVREKVVPA